MKLNFWGKTKELKSQIKKLNQELNEVHQNKVAINNEVFNLSDIHRIIFKTNKRIEGIFTVDFVLKTNSEKYEHIIIEFNSEEKLNSFQEQFINKYHINWFQFINGEKINTQWR